MLHTCAEYLSYCLFLIKILKLIHLYTISSREAVTAKPVNSRLIPKIPMLRGRISALALADTGQLLNYSLLVSDFASWIIFCHVFSKKLA